MSDEIDSWGDGDWGDGYWSGSEYTIPHNRNIALAEQLWDSGIEFAPGSNTYRLVRALLSQADRVDNDLEAIYDAHHIDTASGSDLDKFGDLVGVDRESNEGDARYRARIKARFRAGTIETTYDQFVEFAAAVLDTDIGNIDFITDYDSDPATIRVSANSSVYSDVNLTASDLADLLGDGVPAGHEVKILERGTFLVKADGDPDDADKGLTADGLQTGGTLAADLT